MSKVQHSAVTGYHVGIPISIAKAFDIRKGTEIAYEAIDKNTILMRIVR